MPEMTRKAVYFASANVAFMRDEVGRARRCSH